MKIAINACTWNGYANFMKRECTLEDFLRDVAAAG